MIKIESCVDYCCRQPWIIAASRWSWTGDTSKVEQWWIIMVLGLFLNYCALWTVCLNNCSWDVPNSVWWAVICHEQFAWIIVVTPSTDCCDESWSCIIICLVELLRAVLNFLLMLTWWWVIALRVDMWNCASWILSCQVDGEVIVLWYFNLATFVDF